MRHVHITRLGQVLFLCAWAVVVLALLGANLCQGRGR